MGFFKYCVNFLFSDSAETSGFRRSLSGFIQNVLPPFVVTPEVSSNEKCLKETQVYLDGLDELKMWALTSKYRWVGTFEWHKP